MNNKKIDELSSLIQKIQAYAITVRKLSNDLRETADSSIAESIDWVIEDMINNMVETSADAFRIAHELMKGGSGYDWSKDL